MGWALADVRAMTIGDYVETIAWIEEVTRKREDDDPEGSTDADAMVEAMRAKDAKDRGSD